MDVSITKFRRDIFVLVNQALDGHEVWITHKGHRFQIIPEHSSAMRLGRLTPLEVINPNVPDTDLTLRKEMARAWEQDWATL
jgi:antitoxin (DNA-binding transcriptional repressor) of toxin-antitoxin stability system